MLCRRNQMLYNKLWVDNPKNDFQSKIIRFILLHIENPEGRKLLRVKLYDFANLINASHVNTSIALNQMEKDGLIRLGRMLISKGIDKDDIYRKVFHTYSESRLRLMGYVLENMKVYDCHASLMTLTRDEQGRFDYSKGDSEGFVNIPLQIKGSKLSCFLREDTERAIVKVSLRSVGKFSCTEMAERFFDGGGHLNASGGEIKGTMGQAIARWEEALEAFRSKLTDNEEEKPDTPKEENKEN